MPNRPSAQAVFLGSATNRGGFPEPSLPEVAFVGRSNVGKSSLLNRLAGSRVARVSRSPGRTRMVNFFEIGGAHRLVDLPGYGFARAPHAERSAWEGMVLSYLIGRESLVLNLLLVDSRRDPLALDRDAFTLLRRSGSPTAVIATKADKLTRSAAGASLRALRDAYGEAGATPVIPCSTVVRKGPKRPPPGASGVGVVRRLIAEKVGAWR